MQTKDGRTHRGTTLQAIYRSKRTLSTRVRARWATASNGFNWYLAGNLFAEDGWRDDSPSDMRQIFGKIGWQRDRGDVMVSVGHANNSLTGNGLQEFRLLDRDYSSIYTKPDTTDNRSTLFNFSARRQLNLRLTLRANAYYRDIRTDSVNGDINEESLDQAVYQPDAAEQAALTAAGYTGFPTSGENASNTPFPSWRCIGNALLNDEPSSKCNGLINQTQTSPRHVCLADRRAALRR